MCDLKELIDKKINSFINFLEYIEVYIPILFISRGYDIKNLYAYLKTDHIYDVINENFCGSELNNKLETLTKISNIQNKLKHKEEKIKNAL
jgi:hypothetical protein